MILKILKTDREKTIERTGDSPGLLYEAGTKRVVVAYFPFSTTLDGEKRRGIQLLEQTASVEGVSYIDVVTQINKWDNTRFVDYSFPEQKS